MTMLPAARPSGQATVRHAAPVAGFPSRRPLMLGFLALVALAAGLFGWGVLASISGAVIAGGRVEVETREQVVEHIDGGTVGEILVRDGDRVEAGEVLVRLDGALLRSEAAMLEVEAAELAARRNRLEAEFRDADAIVWDSALASLAEADPTVREILAGQRRLFEARRSSRAGQVAQLQERIGQTGKQIAGLEAQADAARRQRGFIGRELEAQRSLFEKRFTGFHGLLELEREAARLEGLEGDIAARIAGARGRIAEIELAILQIAARRVEEAEGRAREVEARENQVRERLTELRRRLGGMEVRAPVSGEVYGMQVFAPGEVVRPGEPILHIVPADARLMVLAQLEPIHVDQVYPGQDAVLRFSALPARNTPQFEGRVRQVSASTVHDQRTGLAWYEVELAMGRVVEPEEELAVVAWAYGLVAAWFHRGGSAGEDAGVGNADASTKRIDHARDLALSPGMPVEVHIRTGERSPLSYLAKPLTDYFSRSLREQ